MLHSNLVKKLSLFLLFCSIIFSAKAAYIFIPMDENQNNHLKAYGIAFYALEKEVKVDWLLNYQGGSFMIKQHATIEDECNIRGVSYQLIADVQSTQILQSIASPEINQDVVRLEKAPEIAIYSPNNKQPWDDAVTMALTYAEIPYEVIYDEEVLANLLPLYDWLHLHHEDFTGQYGKFYASFKNATWYKDQKIAYEKLAKKLGYNKVSEEKLAVAKKIKEFVTAGGFLFAMCSATDSYDIALANEGNDICQHMFDGDAAAPSAEEKLDFQNVAAPMCKFGCDELYEKGYIGVQNGTVVEVKHGCKTSFINNYISKVIGNKCNSWSRGSKKYFDWHYTWHQDKVMT